jgi:hypothetical protein
MDGVRMTRPSLDLAILYWGRSRREFDSEPGSIPVGAIVETGTAWACRLPWSLLFYFCQLIPRVILLVFPLVSAAIDDENDFKFKLLWN